MVIAAVAARLDAGVDGAPRGGLLGPSIGHPMGGPNSWWQAAPLGRATRVCHGFATGLPRVATALPLPRHPLPPLRLGRAHAAPTSRPGRATASPR